MKKTPIKYHHRDLSLLYVGLLSLFVVVAVSALSYVSNPVPSEKLDLSGSAVTGQNLENQRSPEAPASATATGTAIHHDQDMNMTTVTVSTGSLYNPDRVKFEIDHFKKLAFQSLKFEVFDEKGNPYTPDNLQVTHERKMHFFLVSANLREFQHLHPVFEEGKWKVVANLPNPGTYYCYISVTPVQSSEGVFRGNLIVQKETTGTISYPGLTPDLFAINSGYKAALTLTAPYVNQESKLDYTVTKDGKPARISPYLAAEAHFMLLRHGDVDSFMHVHPDFANVEQGEAGFLTTFKKSGRYTVFTQFGLGQRVYTFPVTFDIQ